MSGNLDHIEDLDYIKDFVEEYGLLRPYWKPKTIKDYYRKHLTKNDKKRISSKTP